MVESDNELIWLIPILLHKLSNCVWSHCLVMAKEILSKDGSFMQSSETKDHEMNCTHAARKQLTKKNYSSTVSLRAPVPLALPRLSPCIVSSSSDVPCLVISYFSPSPHRAYASSPWTASSPMSKSSSDIRNGMKIRIATRMMLVIITFQPTIKKAPAICLPNWAPPTPP